MASAAQAAGGPRLAGAWGSLRHLGAERSLRRASWPKPAPACFQQSLQAEQHGVGALELPPLLERHERLEVVDGHQQQREHLDELLPVLRRVALTSSRSHGGHEQVAALVVVGAVDTDAQTCVGE